MAAGLGIRSPVDAQATEGSALVGTMHLAKGLEFKAVVVMACDENVLPLAERIADVADEFELDEVVATERQLLYVALTRARDRLMVSAIAPGSEFLDHLRQDKNLQTRCGVLTRAEFSTSNSNQRPWLSNR